MKIEAVYLVSCCLVKRNSVSVDFDTGLNQLQSAEMSKKFN